MKAPCGRGCLASVALGGALATVWPEDAALADAIRCDGERYALMSGAGPRPHVRLEADGKPGLFQLDYGSTVSSLAHDAFGTSRKPEGAVVTESFTLPSFEQGEFTLLKYRVPSAAAGGKLGIVGTDFLSLLTADFSFARGGGDVIFSEEPCDGDALRAGGLVAVDQTGFFSADPERVREGMPNVPVLHLSIGGVAAWAQVDTGYDDSVHPPSIDINEALYRELIAAGVSLTKHSETGVWTCAAFEKRAVYRLGEGAVSVTTETGAAVRELPGAKLMVKKRGPCGGIGNMSEPAAQLGISALRMLGRVVFDPKADRVWIPRAGFSGR